MSVQELDRKIEGIFQEADRMFIATAVDGNSSGASVFFARDGQDIVFFTFNTTRKAEQIRVNPYVQLVIWPKGQEGIRGLQVEGICVKIKNAGEKARAREKILQTTEAFREYMDDEFLVKNDVVGYYRIRPTAIKYVNFHAEKKFEWREFPENQIPDIKEMVQSVYRRILLWVRAVRAPFFTATLIPVLLGAVVAFDRIAAAGASVTWDWNLFWLTIIGGMLAHAGTNLSNDYFDHTSRADELNKLFSPFNGGSRVIQAGLVRPWKIIFWAVVCFVVTFIIGLRLNAYITGHPLGNSPLLWLGIAGIILGLFYTMDPFRWGYHGLGEFSIALGFGPIMVLGTHFVMTAPYRLQTGAPWQWEAPLLASLPVGILVMLIVWINQFQDVISDEKVGKNTWVVRMAELEGQHVRYEKPFRYYILFNYVTFTIILALGIIGLINPALATPFALISLLPLILVRKAIHWGREWLERWNGPNPDRQKLPYELLKVNVSTIGIHFLTGLLLILGYWLHGVVG